MTKSQAFRLGQYILRLEFRICKNRRNIQYKVFKSFEKSSFINYYQRLPTLFSLLFLFVFIYFFFIVT